jgi:hypothetical protein
LIERGVLQIPSDDLQKILDKDEIFTLQMEGKIKI